MIELKNTISGVYRFSKKKPNGNIENIGSFESKNLITDGWLDRLNNGFGVAIAVGNGDIRGALSVCAVGTGSNTPVGSDTSLQNELARTDETLGNPINLSHTYTPAPDKLSITGVHLLRYTFPIGAVVGNVSEVGIYHGSFGGSILASRALVRDSSGNPTAITVLADEQLIVDYELTITLATSFESAITFRSGEANEYTGVIRVRASGQWPQNVVNASSTAMWQFSASFSWDALSSSQMQMVATTNAIEFPPSNNVTTPITTVTNFDPVNIPNTSGSTTRLSLTTNILPNTPIGVLYPINTTMNINSRVMLWPIQFVPMITKTETEQLSIDVVTTWSRN